jgi:site-specific DNA-methyltransferase (adenine-specific)
MLINDHFQNYKVYQIPKAQLIIADIPYNLGNNAYASNPSWYKDGDNKNGESELAGKDFFDTDKDFRPAEFMHFCSTMLKKEPKDKGAAPAMIVFASLNNSFI